MFLRLYLFLSLIFYGVICFSYDLQWSQAIQVLSQEADIPELVLTMNRNGQAVATWKHNDGSHDIIQTKYSTDGGQTWSAIPSVLSDISRDATGPRIAMNEKGQAIVVWQINGATYTIQAKYSTDGGQTWSVTAIDLSPLGQDAQDCRVAINESGHAVASWSCNVGADYVVQTKYSSNGGLSWSASPINLSPIGQISYLHQIEMNESDQVVIIWDGYIFAVAVKVQTTYSNDGGQTWNMTPVDLCTTTSSTSPQIAMNEAGQVIAFWTNFDGSYNVVQAKYSTNGGQTWSPTAIDLSASGHNAENPEVALNDKGEGIAIWTYKDVFPDNIIQARYTSDGGQTWSAITANLSDVNGQAWFPQITINNSSQAVAVWHRHDWTYPLNYMIQSKYSTDGGLTWSTTAIDLSEIGEDADDQRVVMNKGGQVIAIWERGDEIQSRAGRFGFNVFYDQFHVELLLQRDYINHLYWESLFDASFYRVYKVTSSLEKLYEGTKPSCYLHGINKNQSNTYRIIMINSSGEESTSETITVP